MSADHRVKIKNSNILNALIEHVEGKRDMSPTQVAAGLGLLRKVLPDMVYSESSNETKHYVAALPAVVPETAAWLKQQTPKLQ
jgi:hypothetical protein